MMEKITKAGKALGFILLALLVLKMSFVVVTTVAKGVALATMLTWGAGTLSLLSAVCYLFYLSKKK